MQTAAGTEVAGHETWPTGAHGMGSTRIVGASAASLARRIAAGDVSAEQVVEAHIARLEVIDRRLNAVTQQRFAEALQEARDADRRRGQASRLGPLHGVPITVKETFDVRGLRTSWGCSRDPLIPVTEDAAAVARLRAAGAIVLCKTNTSQACLFFESDNPVYGRSNNPWDVLRTCGGSSGGEAALLAAGGPPLGLGSDMGGSIRIPAHFCGVHGLKPTSAAVSTRGLRWLLLGGMVPCVAGPLARTVDDLTLAYGVLADRDRLGCSGPRQRATPCDPSDVSLSQLRVGVWVGDAQLMPSPPMRRTLQQAARHLSANGAQMVEFQPGNGEAILALYLGLLSADGGGRLRQAVAGSQLDERVKQILWLTGMPAWLRAALMHHASLRGDMWKAKVLAAARRLSTDQLWSLQETLAAFRDDVCRRFAQQRLDAMLLPPFATVAPPHGGSLQLLPAGFYTFLANLLDWPAGVVTTSRVRADEAAATDHRPGDIWQCAAQCERGSAGLPLGVQVMAPPWHEHTVLAIMKHLEQAGDSMWDRPHLASRGPANLASTAPVAGSISAPITRPDA